MDDNIFWSSVGRGFENDKNLICEKFIYLDDDRTEVLVIGISPHNKMSVAGRLESRASASFLHLDRKALMELLHCVDDCFRGSIDIPKPETDSHEVIKLKMDALLTLRRKLPIIRQEIELLERGQYDKQLFQLLEHFCFETDERIVMKSLNTLRALYMKSDNLELLEKMCQLECECVQKSFVLDITANCLEWFVHCVPLYIKAHTV